MGSDLKESIDYLSKTLVTDDGLSDASEYAKHLGVVMRAARDVESRIQAAVQQARQEEREFVERWLSSLAETFRNRTTESFAPSLSPVMDLLATTPDPQEPDAHLLELMDGIDSLAVEDDPAKQRTILRYIVQRLQRDGRRIRTMESKLVGGSGTTHYNRLDKLEADVAELRRRPTVSDLLRVGSVFTCIIGAAIWAVPVIERTQQIGWAFAFAAAAATVATGVHYLIDRWERHRG